MAKTPCGCGHPDWHGLGLRGAAALTRYLHQLLYGLSALDPATFVGVSLLFATVATLAAFVPARRAAPPKSTRR
jgi:hypothetical protein